MKLTWPNEGIILWGFTVSSVGHRETPCYFQDSVLDAGDTEGDQDIDASTISHSTD